MRRVAERLGVGTMSLYTYVPSKAELLDLMLDTVYGEQVAAIRAATTAAPRRPARPADGRVARRADGAGAGRLGPVPPPSVDLPDRPRPRRLGPNELRVLDATLRVVDGLGLTGREMVAAVDLVAMYVGGARASRSRPPQAPAATGMSDTEWWLARERILAEKMGDGSAFPTVVRVSTDGGFDVAPDAEDYNQAFAVDDFEFGLERVLDGIGEFIAGRRQSA